MRSDKKVAIALIAILTLSAFILVIPVSADGADFGVSPSRHRRNLVRSPSTFQAFDRSLPQSQDSRMKDSSEDGALVQGSIVPGPNQPGHPVGNGDESEYRYDWGAYPMPDVTCDNKTDVLVTFYQWSEDGNYTYRVIAKNGTTGRHLWEESVISSMSKPADIEAHGVLDWDWYWYDDLSGYYDYWYGVDDPYFWDWDWYWDWYLNWDGGDYGDWYKYSKYAPGMADMNGDGKGDVLVWLYEYNYSTDEETETLIAKNGTTGEHLWEENVTGFGWDYVDLWGYGVPDLNGDGTADVLVWLNGYNDSTDEETETLIAKNGTNGKHLWEENVTTIDTEWDYVDLWGYGVPDLNGDGTADVLVCLGGYSTYEETETLIAKNGTNGTHLWEEAISSTLTANLTGATFEPDKGTFCEPLTAIATAELPPGATPLPSAEFPYGFFGFTICGLENGTTVNVTITLPGPIPVGTQYWKYSTTGNGSTTGQPGWYPIPIGDDDGDNVITITVQDGGVGDDDGVANGVIVDDGGPGIGAAAERVPGLTPLGIAALVGLLSILATSTLLKKRKKR